MLNFQTNPMLADAIPAMNQQDLSQNQKLVYKTNDLEQFKALEGNRPVNLAHVKRLIDSIEKNGYLLNPIIINKHKEVIDGQHRLYAAKQLNTYVWVLVDPEAKLKVLTKGLEKYPPNNWEKGMPWTEVIASAMRHLESIRLGEDIDQESGLLHAAHLMCNAAMLAEFHFTHPEFDDRVKYDKDEK